MRVAYYGIPTDVVRGATLVSQRVSEGKDDLQRCKDSITLKNQFYPIIDVIKNKLSITQRFFDIELAVCLVEGPHLVGLGATINEAGATRDVVLVQ